jgi:hypothetical protein
MGAKSHRIRYEAGMAAKVPRPVVSWGGGGKKRREKCSRLKSLETKVDKRKQEETQTVCAHSN